MAARDAFLHATRCLLHRLHPVLEVLNALRYPPDLFSYLAEVLTVAPGLRLSLAENFFGAVGER